MVILVFDRDFWIDKIIQDLKLSLKQIYFITNNPEILFNDIESIKEKLNDILNFIRKIIMYFV
jgi:hypothetical protein